MHMGGRVCVNVRVSAVTRVYSTRTGPGHERTCVFVCACECGTHVYSTRTGPGLVSYSLPGGVYGQNFYWACALYFHVCTYGTVFGLRSASGVSCMCVCVRVWRSACAARALYHSP